MRGVMAASGRRPSMRSRGMSCSGPSRSSAKRGEPPPQLREAAGLDGDAGRVPVSAVLGEQLAAVLQGREQVEPGDAAAGAVGPVPLHREDDGRTMKEVDELRGNDADDPAVPARAPHDEHRVGPDIGIGVHLSPGRGQDLRLLLPPAVVHLLELPGQAPRLVGPALVGQQQQAGRQVRRAHPPRRVDAGGRAGTRRESRSGTLRAARRTRGGPAARSRGASGRAVPGPAWR